MRLALRELRRSSRRFMPTTVALALLVVLLLMLGGLLDGLYIGSTGALRKTSSGAEGSGTPTYTGTQSRLRRHG